MKQFLPKKFCLECRGCCRFADSAAVWLPCLLDKEIKALSKKPVVAMFVSTDKKIVPVPSKDKDIFFCPFLNQRNNKCGIYTLRPFECRLYPFLINRSKGKVYLALDANCPFAKEKQASKAFKGYAAYLACLLNSRAFRTTLNANPQIIQSYPEAVNIAEIKA